jgi:hypothetical protein
VLLIAAAIAVGAAAVWVFLHKLSVENGNRLTSRVSSRPADTPFACYLFRFPVFPAVVLTSRTIRRGRFLRRCCS